MNIITKLKILIQKISKQFSLLPKYSNSKEDGWTFIETLIVIGIIMILSSSVGIMSFKYLDKAKMATAKNQIETFSLALNTYILDCLTYPNEEQGLNALWVIPSSSPVPETWNGPYINKKLGPDPWGNDYIYTTPGPNNLPFELKSLGADGQEGGEGNNADISASGL